MKNPSRWRRSDPRCSTTSLAGANVMMLKRSISAPFPKYDSDYEEEERVQKGIIYQYTIGIIYELPTSSSDNPLTRKRSVFCARVCPRTPC